MIIKTIKNNPITIVSDKESEMFNAEFSMIFFLSYYNCKVRVLKGDLQKNYCCRIKQNPIPSY